MSETKHILWEAVKAPEGQFSPAYYVEVKDGPDVVADVYDLEGDGGARIAHLIAAAPWMYEALEAILDADGNLHEIEAIARTAIAKAEEGASGHECA